MMPTPAGEFRSMRTLEHVLGADPAVVRGFARAVSDHLADGPLTLAARDRLLGRGERLGLKRFDANLVLAAAEHRQRIRPARAQPSAIVATVVDPAARRRPSKWWTAGAAVVLQGVIVTGAWWLLA